MLTLLFIFLGLAAFAVLSLLIARFIGLNSRTLLDTSEALSGSSNEYKTTTTTTTVSDILSQEELSKLIKEVETELTKSLDALTAEENRRTHLKEVDKLVTGLESGKPAKKLTPLAAKKAIRKAVKKPTKKSKAKAVKKTAVKK